MKKLDPISFYVREGWRVTSPFGMRRCPFCLGKGCVKCDFKKEVMHYGVDFGGKPAGAPIKTPYPGIVRAAGYYGDAGNTVSILSKQQKVVFLFMHQQSLRVKPGQMIKEGDVIGLNGTTGKSTAPHLHFEIRHDKGLLFGSSRPAWGDPKNYKDVDPVDEELKKAIEWFVQQGIISSPEYWLENAVAGKMIKGENIAAFILKTAQKLRR